MNKKHQNVNKRVTMSKLIIGIVLLIALIFVYKKIIYKDKLYGIWSSDGRITYQFDGKGSGKLNLPTSEFPFEYKINKNEVYLAFDNEKAKDSDYEYSIDEDELTIKGINTTSGLYTLKRSEK